MASLQQEETLPSPEEEEGQDEELFCRICRLGPDEVQEPLYHPCLCKGSIRFVHDNCLQQWLQHSKKQKCEVCGHRFMFTHVYNEEVPDGLSWNVFLAGVGERAAKALAAALKLCIAGALWAFVVPYAALFCFKYLTSPNGEHMDLSFSRPPLDIIVDSFHGLLLTIAMSGLLLSFVFINEYLSQLNWYDVALMLTRREKRKKEKTVLMEVGILVEDDGGRRGTELEPRHFDSDEDDSDVDSNEGDARPQREEVQPPLRRRNVAAEDRLGQNPLAPFGDGLAHRGPARHFPQRHLEEEEREHENEDMGMANAPDGGFGNMLGDENEEHGDEGFGNDAQFPADHPVEGFDVVKLLKMDYPLREIPKYIGIILIAIVGMSLLEIFVPFSLGRVGCVLLEALLPFEFTLRDKTVVVFTVGISIVLAIVGVADHFTTKLLADVPDRARSPVEVVSATLKVIVFTLIEVLFFPTSAGFAIDYMLILSVGDLLGPGGRSVVQATALGNIVVHYLLGISFMMHVSSTVSLIKELVNPWVLSFIRDPNEPNFEPIYEVIEEHVITQIKRVVYCVGFYGGWAASIFFFPLLLFSGIMTLFGCGDIVFAPPPIAGTVGNFPRRGSIFGFTPAELNVSLYCPTPTLMDSLVLDAHGQRAYETSLTRSMNEIQHMMQLFLFLFTSYFVFSTHSSLKSVGKSVLKWWTLNVGRRFLVSGYILPPEKQDLDAAISMKFVAMGQPHKPQIDVDFVLTAHCRRHNVPYHMQIDKMIDTEKLNANGVRHSIWGFLLFQDLKQLKYRLRPTSYVKRATLFYALTWVVFVLAVCGLVICAFTTSYVLRKMLNSPRSTLAFELWEGGSIFIGTLAMVVPSVRWIMFSRNSDVVRAAILPVKVFVISVLWFVGLSWVTGQVLEHVVVLPLREFRFKNAAVIPVPSFIWGCFLNQVFAKICVELNYIALQNENAFFQSTVGQYIVAYGDRIRLLMTREISTFVARDVIVNIILPPALALGAFLLLPYYIVYGVVQVLVPSIEKETLRTTVIMMFPLIIGMLALAAILALIHWTYKYLHDAIRDDHYRVGAIVNNHVEET
eukprot:CAMPEP_0113909012 /NCGR_PEP_ID=MMETSP0780_2-20120614/26550_1 /TAXON_ID=652834 /ORGANISM="Palpitomonas bilix" /LENGTH=1076 /DNA_ID=CAMNT_0000904643 /DNA_START=73 /DNA_END=3303 /DNA_ORIENTATION=- /assembly_acc=CAM_ASM_000599